jgi:cell wall-associated NlpC family hydrolase
MRRVGRSVSYSEMQPGDIVCYSGHVGIYAGNGKIVNALNEDKGIVMTDVKYSRIITIRRIF